MFGIDSTWSGLVGRIGGSRIIPGLVVVVAAFAATAPGAVSATELIADLNVLGRLEGFDSFGGDAVVLDDRYYIFPATVEHLGREPWVLDTNTGDVQLLGDLSPGSSSSSPGGFVAIAGAVLFAATTPEFGTELWITDGTPAGTQLLLDINPGSASSSPAELYTPNGSGVLFRANDGVSGNELWRSNGTVAGTFQVADINPGAASSSPVEFVLFGAHVYFRAIDATHGSELWRVSTGGVVSLVVDIEPGASSSTPVFLAVAAITPAPQLVFRACRAPEGCEVWRSDGSPAGTTLLADLHPTGSSNPSSFVWHDGLSRIFFTASDGSFGTELWQIQPGVGASRVTDIQVGSLSSSPQGLGVLPSRLVFTANDGGSGTRLFSFDGTTVSQIRNLSTAGVPNSPSNTVTWLDQVYFYEGGGCWRTDGTAAGTVGWSCVSDLDFAIGGGWLFFGQSLSFVRDIWSIDAANVFSRRTEALSYASDPAEATWLGSSVAFAADDGVSGREPWWWDGSGAPVVLDLAPGAGSSNPKSRRVRREGVVRRNDTRDRVRAVFLRRHTCWDHHVRLRCGPLLWSRRRTDGGGRQALRERPVTGPRVPPRSVRRARQQPSGDHGRR